jgi:hypothetical protein
MKSRGGVIIAAALAVCAALFGGSKASAQTWTQTGAPTNGWTSIACSADGIRVAAVSGGQLANGLIYLSTNGGTNWTPALAPAAHWMSIASSGDGKVLTAASYGGGLYTSTNFGTTWFTNSQVAGNWRAVAASVNGSVLAAVLFNTQVYRSTNFGRIFDPMSAGPADLQSIAVSADGKVLAAGNNTGLITISTNSGASWNMTTNLGGGGINGAIAGLALANNGKTLAALQIRGVSISTNLGSTWSTNNNLPSDSSWYAITSSADGSRLTAVGQKQISYSSSDSGTTWTSNNVPGLFWQSVASSADGKTAYAVSAFGGSLSGQIWTSQSPPPTQLSLKTAGSNLLLSWIVPSRDFVLQQSSDLNGWTTVTNIPVLNFTNLNDQVSLPLSTGDRFFRLKTP